MGIDQEAGGHPALLLDGGRTAAPPAHGYPPLLLSVGLAVQATTGPRGLPIGPGGRASGCSRSWWAGLGVLAVLAAALGGGGLLLRLRGA